MGYFAMGFIWLVLGVAMIVTQFRLAKLIIKAINRIFTFLENKLP